MRDGGLRQIFQKHMPSVHWQAIESWETGIGIPDLNGCVDGVEFWIELKQATANAVKISPGQIAWIERRVRAGGNVYIAVRCKAERGKRRLARDELYLYSGNAVRLVYSDGIATPPLRKFVGGPSSWDWAEIRRILCRIPPS